MKYLIPFLTFILFLYGIFLLCISIWHGVGIFAVLLTITTFTGLISLFFNKKIGLIIIFIASVSWIINYFERASFLVLYNHYYFGGWLIITIPFLISIILFSLIYKSRQDSLNRPFKIIFVLLSIFAFMSIGMFTFIRKPHINEFNCWYYIDNNKKDFKIKFYISQDQFFVTTSNSDRLKKFILKNGMRDESRDGIYCPETKVKVITRFKKIVSVEILGFRNSNTDYKATLNEPVEIDINKINGDKELLQPDFIWSY